MTDRLASDRRLAAAGVAAPVLTLGTILLATLVSPDFSWTGNALSNLGAATPVATPLTRLLFNGGLLLGALLGLAFAVLCWRRASGPAERVGAAVLALGLVAMGGVGVFPQDRALHAPMAIGFYLLATLAFWAYGVGWYRAGARRRGLASAGVGLLHVLGWALWIGAGPSRPGLAIPEIVGAALFGGWTLWLAGHYRAKG